MTGSSRLQGDATLGRRGLRNDIETIRRHLGRRSIVLVGLMGAGKTTIGRRLAHYLAIPFVDADTEIETAAGKTIPEIFADHGEIHFRDGERRVIARLLQSGPQVLATGGGAYMNDETRSNIRKLAVSVWLRADLELLLDRVRKRTNRPLLNTSDPEAVMRQLMEDRYPVYSQADVRVDSRNASHRAVVCDVLAAVARFLEDKDVQMTPSPAATARPEGWLGAVTRVPVALGERSYEVLIGEGLLSRAGTLIGPHLRRPLTAIVTDENVARHHLEALRQGLAGTGVASEAIVLAPGEASKSFAELANLCDRLLGAGIERGDCIIALGGGVIGDLTGFAAAIVRRGIGFIQVPTTLLAQVDSSVGGKTGINSSLGKNLIGAFHQPRLVIVDSAVLSTLPRRELAAGYAEVVKYGLIGDSNFFAWLEANAGELFAGHRGARAHAIQVSCQAKARIVAADETETGVRALLNLGHTFGHAFEAAAGYGEQLLHGEAVAAGMAMAFRFSERIGACRPGTAERVAAHLASVGLPTGPRDLPVDLPGPDGLLAIMRQDKKARDGRLTLILARDIGEAFIAPDVADEDILSFLGEELGRP